MAKEKKIIMEAKFRAHPVSGRTLTWYVDNRGSIDIGGFEVMVDGYKEPIPFDFESTSLAVHPDGTYSFGNWNGFTHKVFDVDSYHEEYWESNGLTKEDITAKLLANASEITDFYFCVEDPCGNAVECELELISIEFTDENDECFAISNEVLDNFNKIHKDAFIGVLMKED